MTDKRNDQPAPETIAAAHGVASDPAFGAVVPPLYLSSTYEFAGYDQPRAYDYGRQGNPTRDLLADALARLEGGAGAVITSSGMAAIDLLVSQLRQGAGVIAPHDCYGGTIRLLKARAERGQIALHLVDQSDEAAFARALAEKPALVFIETPSNPLMRVVDIALLARLARAAGAEVAVDNTFLSPALQQPIALGADYAVHSTTKYLNGHSDVIAGAVIAATPAQTARLRHWANVVGSTGAPFDAWLTLRGLRTLFARIERQQANALAVARHLEFASGRRAGLLSRPALPCRPCHRPAPAARRRGDAQRRSGRRGARRCSASSARCAASPSPNRWAGWRVLVAHPATMTHADMGEEARRVAGIGDGLLRLSIGLEHERDLLAGLDQGLAAC